MSSFVCDTCSLDFSTKTMLANHKYNVHVDSLKVNVNDEVLSVDRIDKKFACPKCDSQLSTPTTFKCHFIKWHQGSGFSIAATDSSSTSRKRSYSEVNSSCGESNERTSRLRVNENGSSSSLPVPFLSDYDQCVLKATGALNSSRMRQKFILVLILYMKLKPIYYNPRSDQEFPLLASQKTEDKIIEIGQAGQWRLPSKYSQAQA